MFVTHGTYSGIPVPGESDYEESLGALAQNAAIFAADHGLALDWDIVTLDWGPYSTGPLDTFALYNPYESARISQDIAESLVNWLRELWGENAAQVAYQRYHLLSHSSGSYLIDRMSVALIREGLALRERMHLTFFDVFAPPADSSRLGVALGASAGYAEQYIDTYFEPTNPYGASPPGTNTDFPSMLNIDVTEFDHSKSPLPPFVEAHAWPYVWYLATIPAIGQPLPTCNGLQSGWGFPMSPMARDVETRVCTPARTLQSLGFEAVLLPSGTRRLPPFDWFAPLRDLMGVSGTGRVMIAENGNVQLATGSPVWADLGFQLPIATRYMRFQFRFVTGGANGAQGILRVFHGEHVLLEAPEFGGQLDTTQTEPIYLGEEIGPGWVTLRFQVDPQSSVQSIVEIPTIEFGGTVGRPCEGDVNADDRVDIVDLSILLSHFGISVGARLSDGDIDGDGAIGLGDLSSLLQAFGTDCGAQPCAGDANLDQNVDLVDLSIALAHFGTSAGATRAEGDVSGDGAVNLNDLAVILQNFGSTCDTNPPPPPCPGDANGDRRRDLADLSALLSHFGQAVSATTVDGDFDGDGAVSIADLAILLGFFGSDCP